MKKSVALEKLLKGYNFLQRAINSNIFPENLYLSILIYTSAVADMGISFIILAKLKTFYVIFLFEAINIKVFNRLLNDVYFLF